MATFGERRRGGLRAKKLGVHDTTNTIDSAVPLVTASSGAASAADPDGSLHLRTDGAPEYRIGGAWGAVAVTGGLFDLNGLADGLVLDADGDTTISAPTDNQIDIEINSADDFQFTANTFTALSGSTIKTDTIAETTSAAGVTIDSTLLKDGEVVLADDKGVVFGTSSDFEATWTNASERMDMLGANKTDASSGALSIATGSATSATGAKTTGALTIATGTSTTAGNNSGASGAITIATGASAAATAHTGAASGDLTLATGASDTTDAGATGGGSGNVSLKSGAASSTAGAASGNTGTVTVGSGNSADGNSGHVTVSTGTAGGTRGDVTLSGDQIVLTAATGIDVPDSIPVRFGATFDHIIQWTNASERMDITGLDKTNAASGALLIDTGSSTSVDGARVTGAIDLKSGVSSANGNNGGASGAIVIASGSTTTLTAHTGGVSGNVSVATGDTNGAFAGSTGGQSGDLTLATGAASSTAGTSAASGAAYLQTGSSEDSNTGNVTIRSGAPAATGTSGTVAISTGNCAGAGISGNITLTCGTTAAGTQGSITATANNINLSATTAVKIPDDIDLIWGSSSDYVAEWVNGSEQMQFRGLDKTDAASGSVYLDTGSATSATGANATGGVELVSGASTANGNNGGQSGAMSLHSGTTTTATAHTGGNSGAVRLYSGATDANFAGSTAGASGDVGVYTGASTSTIGTSGASGKVDVYTGASDDSGTGGVNIYTGAPAATGTSGTIAIYTGATSGAGTSGGITLTTGTTAAGTRGDITCTADQILLSAVTSVDVPDTVPVRLGAAYDYQLQWNNASNQGEIVGLNVADSASGALYVDTGNATSVTGARVSGGITLASGTSTTGGNAGGITGAISIASGASTAASAHTGGRSGGITISSGVCDSTDAGGTAGESGDISIASGASTSTLGTSGDTGDVAIATGASTDAASGSITLTVGAAGTTAGTIQAIGRLTTTDGVTAGTARVVGGLAYRSVARSGVSTNTTDETVFATTGTYSIPANTLKAGSVIRYRAFVFVADQNAGDTLTIAIRLGGVGGTVLLTSTAVDVADNDIGILDGTCQVRTAGAGGTLIAFGTRLLGVPGTATATGYSVAETAVNTTGALDLVCTWDWSAGHDDNDCYLDCFEVWID